LKRDIKIVYLHSNSQDLHSWIAINDKDAVVGHLYMQVEKDNKILFMDAWVCEKHRRLGIFRKMWETRWDYVVNNYKGYNVYSWCKDSSLNFVLSKGFEAGELCTYVSRKVS
tara:strand:- start:240 stop:575 length:336 start_codon:yes stop_codon:yes gene_type:complete